MLLGCYNDYDTYWHPTLRKAPRNKINMRAMIKIVIARPLRKLPLLISYLDQDRSGRDPYQHLLHRRPLQRQLERPSGFLQQLDTLRLLLNALK